MTVATEAPLLFQWTPPRRRARALIACIAASVLLHAFCFYVFQIVYPPVVTIAPPPARVSLITNTSEDGRALLRWIDAEDPALASATQRPPDAKARALPKLQHIPSYINARTPLKELPPLLVDLRPPSAQPPGPVPTFTNPPATSVNRVPTNVTFSEEVAAFGEAKLPPAKFNASTSEQPDNIRFRVAVNSLGEVQYCFPLNSSGDSALNEQARQHIALTRFERRSTSSNETLVWGIATLQWGNDVIVPPTRSTSTSSP